MWLPLYGSDPTRGSGSGSGSEECCESRLEWNRGRQELGLSRFRSALLPPSGSANSVNRGLLAGLLQRKLSARMVALAQSSTKLCQAVSVELVSEEQIAGDLQYLRGTAMCASAICMCPLPGSCMRTHLRDFHPRPI